MVGAAVEDGVEIVRGRRTSTAAQRRTDRVPVDEPTGDTCVPQLIAPGALEATPRKQAVRDPARETASRPQRAQRMTGSATHAVRKGDAPALARVPLLYVGAAARAARAARGALTQRAVAAPTLPPRGALPATLAAPDSLRGRRCTQPPTTPECAIRARSPGPAPDTPGSPQSRQGLEAGRALVPGLQAELQRVAITSSCGASHQLGQGAPSSYLEQRLDSQPTRACRPAHQSVAGRGAPSREPGRRPRPRREAGAAAARVK